MHDQSVYMYTYEQFGVQTDSSKNWSVLQGPGTAGQGCPAIDEANIPEQGGVSLRNCASNSIAIMTLAYGQPVRKLLKCSLWLWCRFLA